MLKLNLTETLVLTFSLQEIQEIGGQIKFYYKEAIIQIQNISPSEG